MRIPAMFINVAPLEDNDIEDVEKKITEEVGIFRERALKKID